MKVSRLFIPLAVMAASIGAVGCDDDTSQIGNSLTEGNVSIYIDSLTFNLEARGVENQNYDSRSGSLLLGSVNVPEYGLLHSSFISRLMCVTSLNIPEEVDVNMIDSCQMWLNMSRGDLVGDSLAPQVVNVYRLLTQIPDDITNEFNPVEEIGYDNMELMGSKSFTASGMHLNDSLYYRNSGVNIQVDLGQEFAKKIFLEYKENPSTFQWPQNFAKDFLPGIFVETSFGRGCVSTIQALAVALFYHTVEEKKQTVDDKEVVTYENVPDTIYPFSVSPEVLSSNNINYTPAESLVQRIENGDIIITTPGGYNAAFRFPAREIIDKYKSDEHNLSLVSNLTLTIPADAMENDYGLTTAPNLLLIKTSELKDFFINNKLPDDKTSFTATYDAENKKYTFSSMRSYILSLLNKSEITEDDVDFSIVPVNLVTSSQSDYYGSTTTTYVTKCLPYTLRPTMTRLYTDKALIVFSFSSQKFD